MSLEAWHELEGPAPKSVTVAGVELRRGSRVRLHPIDRRDVFAAALDGRTAVVEGIEELIGGGIQLAVSPDDDPGRDLGPARPGHRFFFAPQEVEPLARVLVAGVGNMFLGDDGFGCEVANRLRETGLPAGVDVADYGIRGFDLAYALASGYEAAVLIDAAPLGGPPGTLAVIEPPADDDAADIDTHGMHPVRVLRLARELGGAPARTLVLACQPEVIADPDENGDVVAELSPAVRAAIERAVPAVHELVTELLAERPKGGTTQ
jgi:hydrogenase maturation protease